jgi:Asp/Glu/hydantoin racemase
MKVRIWHQSMTDLQNLPRYRTNIRSHAGKILAPDVVVEPHGMPPGIYGDQAPVDVLKYPYIEFLCERYTCEAALTAEREKFDLMAIGCYLDTGLKRCRSLVDIPVVAVTESSMLVACALGKKFGFVTIGPSMQASIAASAEEYGLSGRMACVVAMDPPIDEYDLEGNPEAGASAEASFMRSCRKALDLGADVIIPGEGVLNEFVFERDLSQYDGAPILDGNAALWQYGIMLANLRQKNHLTVSRGFAYLHPDEELLRSIRNFHGLRAFGSGDFS